MDPKILEVLGKGLGLETPDAEAVKANVEKALAEIKANSEQPLAEVKE